MSGKSGDNLRAALRVARLSQRLEELPGYDEQREPVAQLVRRTRGLRTPDLPDWLQTIRPHDPAWPERFRREAERISLALGHDTLVEVQHIGSSAIPHLSSKPALDLLAVVRGDIGTPEQLETLAANGYRHFGNSPLGPEVEWVWNLEDETCVLVLHLCAPDSPCLSRALRFREYMCAHPEECARYEQLKQELAASSGSLLEYSLGKLTLFFEIDARHKVWRGARQSRSARRS